MLVLRVFFLFNLYCLNFQQADEAYAQSLLTDKEKLDRLATKEFYKTSTQRYVPSSALQMFLQASAVLHNLLLLIME